jgi:hypothetical protein
METSLNLFDFASNETFIVITLYFAVMRIYLELISFKFDKLPLTKLMSKRYGNTRLTNIHKTGLIFSVGYVLLFAPPILFS